MWSAMASWLWKIVRSEGPHYRHGALYWYRDGQWIRLTPEEEYEYLWWWAIK